MNPREIRIGKSVIGLDHPAYFIADIAANWDGDLERAKDLIHLCAQAGASAAKFQNFQAQTIVSDFGFRQLAAGGRIAHQSAWKKSVFEVYKQASLPVEWTAVLKETCAKAGIDYFTTPYDPDQVPLLRDYVAAWKLGSGDITWHAFIEMLAKDGKPLLLASGASTMEEVRLAMAAASRHTKDLVLMQCNTNYTASIENFNHIHLNVLKTFAAEFPDVVLGLSDHTAGHATVLGAVTLGARVIEKHFTDDNGREGPDHKFSMTPATWREMVDRTRELERSLGSDQKRLADNERESVLVQRRAVRARHAIPKGTKLAASDFIMLRPIPPDGVPPYQAGKLLSGVANRDIPEGDCIRLADIS
jgi:sialic acid synthase SpsE